jgi:choline-sulfatase
VSSHVGAVRLIDVFSTAEVRGSPPAAERAPRAEWRFAAGSEPIWKAGPGVEELAVRGTLLTGKTTTQIPILHVAFAPGEADRDLVHAIEVRLRASAGANFGVRWADAEKLDLDEAVARTKAFPWPFTSPLVADGELHTYTLTGKRDVEAGRIRHLLLRPTDVAGADFELESVRVILRREHLAGIPSGVSWQGLSEVFRESLVARSPESIRIPLELPSRPWLDLAIGTIEDAPVTFRVSASRGNEPSRVLLERTVTRAHRWDSVAIDLAALAGQRVTLALDLVAEKPGTLGFWGSPAVRERLVAAKPPSAPDAPQGVILIVCDTLRRDHLGLYGYERDTAPVLGRMAKEGALIRDCVTQASWTKVSMTSILTSLYPSTHGVADIPDRLPASANTLAESFRAAGYATISLSSVVFTGTFTNLHQGFEELHERASLADGETSKTARDYVDCLLPWLDAHRDTPFFAYLHVFDPHDPFEPRAPYDALWADPARKPEHEAQLEAARKVIADPLLKMFGMPTRDELTRAGVDPERFVAQELDWYDGSIRAMDAEIGRLLERLRELGLDRRTLVAFTSDHGEEFLEHGRSFHGQSIYGELTQVPLLFWGPGLLEPTPTIEQTVESIDIMPTLLELARVPAPAGMQGVSLAPLLASGGTAWQARPAFSEKRSTTYGTGPAPRETAAASIIGGNWKLIRNSGGAKAQFELFDRSKDPLDAQDLAAQHPDIVAQLSRQLEEWQTRVTQARLEAGDKIEELDSQQLDHLRSLGYIK